MRWVSARATLRLRRRVLSVLALTFVFVFGMAQSAYADVIAEGPGVRGRGDWTWGVRELTGIYLGVRDLVCDGDPVYVHLRVYFSNGTEWYDTQHRENSGGCGTARDWFNLYTSSGATISGVRVRACVNRNWTADDCYNSTYHDNPMT